jgi:hypothetical protein
LLRADVRRKQVYHLATGGRKGRTDLSSQVVPC